MPRWSPLPFPGTSGLASHGGRWEFGQLGDLYFDVMTRLGDAANFDTVEAVVKDFSGCPSSEYVQLRNQGLRAVPA